MSANTIHYALVPASGFSNRMASSENGTMDDLHQFCVAFVSNIRTLRFTNIRRCTRDQIASIKVNINT